MIQGFYWDSTPNVWYNYLDERAEELGLAGFDGIWLPPPSRGAAGPWDVGYTPYDYYDLGEFAGPTRYGTRSQLENAVSRLKDNGLRVYMDIVLNHRSGGQLEPNIYAHYYTDRNGGSLYSPDGENTFTAFPLPGGSGRISWPVGEGNEFFFPNNNHNPSNTFDFYSDSQLLGFHQMYTNSFAYSNALHTGTGDTLPMGDSLMVWADWLTNTLDLDGYRFDFVKGIHPEYLKNFMKYGAMNGKFHVHEFYDGNMQRIRDYITLVNTGFNSLSPSSPPSREGAIFDFNLHFAYKEMSDAGDAFDIRTLHGRGLFNQSGVLHEHIATFVENHDFDRMDHEGNITAPGHSPIINLKELAYAHMMTHPGYATVWWRDYFYYGLKDQINMMLAIRSQLASGGHQILTARGDVHWPGFQPTDERNLYIMQRNGIDDQTGLIFAMNKHQDFDIGAWVTNIRDDWRNRDLYDVTGNVSGTTRVFNDGRVYIHANRNSWSVFIPVDYEFELPSGISVSDMDDLYDLYLPGQPINIGAELLSEDIQHREVTVELTAVPATGSDTFSTSTMASVSPFQRTSVTFDPLVIDTPGVYTITVSLSDGPAGSVTEQETTIEIIDPVSGTYRGYAGNERTTSGGTIGEAAIFISENDTHVEFIINKGAGDFDEMLVLYLQTGNAGRTRIDSSVNDTNDLHRRAISSTGSASADIHFPAGFEASHAIAVNNDFAGIWEIPVSGTVGSGGLQFRGDISHEASGSGNTFRLQVPKSVLASNGDVSLGFVGVYLDVSDISPSSEAFGYGLTGVRADESPVVFTGYHVYPEGQSRFPAHISGGEGWRLLSVPVTGLTVSDIANQNLVQGVSGSYPDAAANIFTDYNGLPDDNSDGRNAGWQSPGSLTVELQPGKAFLWYLYDNDLVPESRPLPFTLSAGGSAPSDDMIEVSLHAQGNRFNLFGNPFGDPLFVGDITGWASGGTMQSTVHLWDHETEGGTWTSASLSRNDRIAVWQGALIENNNASAINIPRSARTQGAELLESPGNARIGFELSVTDGKTTRHDHNATILFHEGASMVWDVFDASKLLPLSSSYVTFAFRGERDEEEVLQSQFSLPFDFSEVIEIPVEISAVNIGGEATVRWPVWREIPEHLKVTLVDIATGKQILLSENTSYTFDVSGDKKLKSKDEVQLGSVLKSDGNTSFLIRIQNLLESENGTPQELPEVVALRQNYPNPFNPGTVITFDIPETTDVRLEVYNIQGQRVATLVNESRSAGTHQVAFNAGNLASGVYIYRLTTGTQLLTRKMTLVK